jgi:hypothetical protein
MGGSLTADDGARGKTTQRFEIVQLGIELNTLTRRPAA